MWAACTIFVQDFGQSRGFNSGFEDDCFDEEAGGNGKLDMSPNPHAHSKGTVAKPERISPEYLWPEAQNSPSTVNSTVDSSAALAICQKCPIRN